MATKQEVRDIIQALVDGKTKAVREELAEQLKLKLWERELEMIKVIKKLSEKTEAPKNNKVSKPAGLQFLQAEKAPRMRKVMCSYPLCKKSKVTDKMEQIWCSEHKKEG